MLQELKINETPVRTSRNLNINNIKISIWKKLSVKIEGGIEIIAAV